MNYAFCVAGIMLPSSRPQMPPLNILSPTKLTSKKSSRSFSSAPKEEFIRYEPPIMIQTTKDSFFFIFSRTFGFHPNWFVENPPLMFFSKQSPSNTSASSGEYSLSLFLSFFVFVSSFLFVFCVESVLVFIQHKRFFRRTSFLCEVN